VKRQPAYSLYELRRHPTRRGLSRSTGTRPSRRFAWWLTFEGAAIIAGTAGLLLYLQRVTMGQ